VTISAVTRRSREPGRVTTCETPSHHARRTTETKRGRGAGTVPAALRKAGRARIDAGLKKHAARRHAARTNRIIQALTKQTAMVAGTAAADTVRPTRPANSPPRAPKRADSPVMVDSGWHRPALPAGRRRRPGRDPGASPPSSQGERHNQALLALDPRRVTLHAMIRDAALTTRSQQHNAA